MSVYNHSATSAAPIQRNALLRFVIGDVGFGVDGYLFFGDMRLLLIYSLFVGNNLLYYANVNILISFVGSKANFPIDLLGSRKRCQS